MRIILTSYGLTTSIGRKLIGKELAKDYLEDKRIFLFHEPHYSIEPMLREACLYMGFKSENIIFSGQKYSFKDLETVDYIYVTEGNTFEVLALLRERELIPVIRKAFENGATYIGASAGAMIAGVSIEEALSFDRNFVRMDDFEGLKLFNGIVIPHYTKKELNQYIKNSPGMKQKYKKIYNVENEKMIIIETEV